MSDDERDGSGAGDKANSGEAAKTADDSPLKKAAYAFIASVLTTVVGAGITSFYQQNSQSYQKKIDQIATDVKSARDAQSATMKLVDTRFLSANRYAQALDKKASGKDPQGHETKDAERDYDAVKKDWESQFDDVATRIAFDIDAPFMIEKFADFANIYRLDCQSYTLSDKAHNRDGGADPLSARAILEVLNHCHDLLNGKLESVANAAKVDAKDALDQGRRIHEHIFRVNEVLRCTLMARVVSVQRSAADLNVLSWLLPGQNEAGYKIRDHNQKCVDPYRDDKNYGAGVPSPASAARP